MKLEVPKQSQGHLRNSAEQQRYAKLLWHPGETEKEAKDSAPAAKSQCSKSWDLKLQPGKFKSVSVMIQVAKWLHFLVAAIENPFFILFF